jgi:hypothetical protein
MPLEELFEAARNDEPIVSDEVAVLRNGVEVALRSRPPSAVAFTSCKAGATSKSGGVRRTWLELKG